MAIKEIIDAERLTHNFSLNRIQAAADRRIAEVEAEVRRVVVDEQIAELEEKDKAIAELVEFVGCVANSFMAHPDYGDDGAEFTDLVDTADELIAKYGRADA